MNFMFTYLVMADPLNVFFFSLEGDRRRWQLLRDAIHAKRMLLRIAGRSLNGMAFSTETGSSR